MVKYNRFVNKFFHAKHSESFCGYIFSELKNKNFIYLTSPRRVEELASYLYRQSIEKGGISVKDNNELLKLSATLANYVHQDFYCVDYIKKGILYLHGKMPDLIKEFLEYKFREIPSIKMVIANSVILEGVNFPIDTLFIMNTWSLNKKDLINLVGRVNRLNDVFSDSCDDLSKLLPDVHFINTEQYSGTNRFMKNKIELLKVGSIKDNVTNPILLRFDKKKYDAELKKIESSELGDDVRSNYVDSVDSVISRENKILECEGGGGDDVLLSFMESNVYSLYTDPELAISRIKNRSLQLKLMGSWSEINVIDKIHMVFISGMEPLLRSDSIVRLKHEQARNFYKMFVDDIHRLSLKEHIEKTVAYFYKIKNEAKGREFYIGTSYGDKFIKKENGEYSKKAYIDLSRLNHKQLVNIALVKIKIESDFLSFVINEYVKLLFDLSLIDENEYNIFVYGTPKKSSSVLKQLGLSGSLLSKLEADNQIGNIGVDENGCLQFNDLFRVYISQQDDFVQFEINKFASL